MAKKAELSKEEVMAEEIAAQENAAHETEAQETAEQESIVAEKKDEQPEGAKETAAVKKKTAVRASRSKRQNDGTAKLNTNDVITLHKNSVISSMKDEESERWHDLQNSYLTKKVLTGTLSSIERMRISEDQTMQVAIADYMLRNILHGPVFSHINQINSSHL